MFKLGFQPLILIGENEKNLISSIRFIYSLESNFYHKNQRNWKN